MLYPLKLAKKVFDFFHFSDLVDFLHFIYILRRGCILIDSILLRGCILIVSILLRGCILIVSKIDLS